MSPLAPQQQATKVNEGTDRPTSEDEANRILTSNMPKVVYSMSDLFELRHNRSQAPNSGNCNVLAMISRPTITQPKSNFSSMISFNLMASAFNQIDRRPQSRLPQRQNHYNGNGFGGDRQRQAKDRCPINGSQNGIHIRLIIKNDIKLNEAENAWKPSFLKKNQKNDDDDDAAEVYKQVRLILNKLTDKNFAVLSEQFESLKIDTKEKLVEVINLVFNKAVNEPNFSECYGKLCQHLSYCSKHIDSSSNEQAYFKRTLINKCQIEFEQHVANKNTTDAALEPLKAKLAECKKQKDLNGINEFKSQIAEEESILRRRLVSTVRFIGELYKLDMLTTNIMNVCINTLIREAAPNQSNTTQANEKLECLCKLLTTVGGKLECKPIEKSDKTKAQCLDLNNYMNQLKRIADNKIRNFKASTRIRFMIMDVIELRNQKWLPKIKIAQIN